VSACWGDSRLQSSILKLVVQNYAGLTSQLHGSLDSRTRTGELDSLVSELEGDLDGNPVGFVPPELPFPTRSLTFLSCLD
jgi:hypothetical protein